MPTIKFVELNGEERVVEATIGHSLMQVATDNLVPGIIADCGGSCVCATCHAYIDDEWLARLPPPASTESDMLTCVMDQRSNSRLTCQIKMTSDLDGMVVHMAQNEI